MKVLAAIIAITLSGCSLLLDPENCTNNAECAPGVCKDGVCFGAAAVDTPDVDEPDGADMGEDTADAAVDLDEGPTPDMGDAAPIPDGAPDGPPRLLSPMCEFLAPLANARLVGETEVEIQAAVFDGDTPIDQLVVTLGGEPVELDEAGTLTTSIALEEGANSIVLVATDVDDQSCTARITVVSDTTAPVVTLDQPGAARTLTNRATFHFVGSVDDANLDEDLVVMRGGNPLDVEISWRGDRFEFDVDLRPGPNAFELTSEDQVGNLSEPVSTTLTLDTDPPLMEVTEPRDGVRTGADSVLVSGTVDTDDEFFVSQVTITVTNSGAGGRYNVNAPGGVFSRVRVQLAQGENTIEACGDDAAGNLGCDTVVVTRENQQPCVTIEGPLPGAFVNAAAVTVTGTVCPVVTAVTIDVPGAEAAVGEVAGGMFTAQVMLPAAGRHTLTATASTENGSEATDSVAITYDSSAPTVRITSPDAGGCYNEINIQVCGTVSDPQSGVVSLRPLAGGIRGDELPEPRANFCVPIAAPEGANREIIIEADNGAGLSGRASVVVNVDLSAPRITPDIARDAFVPVDGTGRVAISGQIQINDICDISRLIINGRDQAILAGGRFNFRGQFEDGPQAIAIVAIDQAGNRGEQNFSFRVDSAEPTLENIVPAEPTVTAEQIFTIRAKTCDSGSRLDPARVTIGPAPGNSVVPTPAPEPGCFNIERTVGVPEGVTRFDIVVHDMVGNRNSHTVTLSRDVTPPTLTVTFPRPNTAVESTLIVEGTVDDGELGSGVNRVEVNGVEAVVDRFRGTWRAIGVRVGPRLEIEVAAFDNGGNGTVPPIVIPVLLPEYVLTDRERKGLSGADTTGWVGVFDVNNDSRLDIVALTNSVDGRTAVFTQEVDGTYRSRGNLETGLPNGEVTDVAVGDFDEDGRTDLFIVGNNINGLWTGEVDVGFDQVAVGAAVGLASTGLAVGDVNRDGHLDVLIFAANETRMLFGTGLGGFDREPLFNLDIAEASSYQDGDFVDVNGDGVLDLVAFGPTGARLWIGDRSGVFTAPGAPIPNTPTRTTALIDANRDGRLDLYAAVPGAGRFVIGDGSGLPNEAARGLVLAAGESHAIPVDFDGDARDDLVVFGPAGFKLWRNDAANSFQRVDEAALGIPPLINVRATAVADIDGDGDFDIIGADADGPFLIRSNAAALRDGYRYVYLDVRRSQPGEQGPRDGVGVQILQNLAGDDAPERAIAANAGWPTLVTLGGAQAGNFAVRYVDLGAVGVNVRSIGPVDPRSTTIVSARE